MPPVVLSRKVSHDGLIEALATAGALSGRLDRIAFQLPVGCFIAPDAVGFLGVWGMDARNHAATLVFVGGDDAIRYLSRIDLLAALDVAYEEDFERRAEVGRFLPVSLIEGAEDCKRATDAICDLVLHRFDNAREFLPALEWSVNEVVDNILLHSEAPVPGVVCAQHFPVRRRLEVAICDLGRGIKASLSESMTLYSHGHAITEALKRGVTRNPEVGMGNGLAGTREICRVNGGDFQLWTGDVTWRMSGGVDKGFVPMPEVRGTGVYLSLDTARPVPLAETFIGGAAYSYLEAEGDRALREGGLRVAAECLHTGSRGPATGLRRKVLSLLPDMEGPLILDFDGVPRASSSFLDELLGRLAATLGIEEFQARIHVVNASREIRDMANVVIQQRLAMREPPEDVG